MVGIVPGHSVWDTLRDTGISGALPSPQAPLLCTAPKGVSYDLQPFTHHPPTHTHKHPIIRVTRIPEPKIKMEKMAGRMEFPLNAPHSMEAVQGPTCSTVARTIQSERHKLLLGHVSSALPALLSPPIHPSHALLSAQRALHPHQRAGAPVAWQGWVPGAKALSTSGLASSSQPTVVTACLPWLREQSQNCALMPPARTTRLARRQGPEPQPTVAHTTQPQTLSVIKPTISEMRGRTQPPPSPSPALVVTIPKGGWGTEVQDSSSSRGPGRHLKGFPGERTQSQAVPCRKGTWIRNVRGTLCYDSGPLLLRPKEEI